MPIESRALQWGVQKLIRMAQDGDVENLWPGMQALAPECRRLVVDAGRSARGEVAPERRVAAPRPVMVEPTG